MYYINKNCSTQYFREKTSVGCVGESLIPFNKAYLVEFQDRKTSNDPKLCWKTCEAVYPNTSLGTFIMNWPIWNVLNLISSITGIFVFIKLFHIYE